MIVVADAVNDAVGGGGGGGGQPPPRIVSTSWGLLADSREARFVWLPVVDRPMLRRPPSAAAARLVTPTLVHVLIRMGPEAPLAVAANGGWLVAVIVDSPHVVSATR